MSSGALPCADSCRTLFTNCSKAEAIISWVQCGGNLHCLSFKRQKQLRPGWDRGPQSRHWYEVIARSLIKKKWERQSNVRFFKSHPHDVPIFCSFTPLKMNNLLIILCSQYLIYLHLFYSKHCCLKKKEMTKVTRFAPKIVWRVRTYLQQRCKRPKLLL